MDRWRSDWKMTRQFLGKMKSSTVCSRAPQVCSSVSLEQLELRTLFLPKLNIYWDLSRFIDLYRPLVPLKHRWNTILRRSCRHNQSRSHREWKEYDLWWRWTFANLELTRSREGYFVKQFSTYILRQMKQTHPFSDCRIPTQASTQAQDNANGAHPRGPTWLR